MQAYGNYRVRFFRVFCPKCAVTVGDYRALGQASNALKAHNAADDARGLKGKGRRAHLMELAPTS